VQSSAGSHLVSAILRQATGRSTLDYARAKLFTPLENKRYR
jgi:CubicO group peptidase (beta-lactamase class C family)